MIFHTYYKWNISLWCVLFRLVSINQNVRNIFHKKRGSKNYSHGNNWNQRDMCKITGETSSHYPDRRCVLWTLLRQKVCAVNITLVAYLGTITESFSILLMGDVIKYLILRMVSLLANKSWDIRREQKWDQNWNKQISGILEVIVEKGWGTHSSHYSSLKALVSYLVLPHW